MTDIVELLRLRAARKWTDVADRSASLFGQAADEIERLRAARGEPVAWGAFYFGGKRSGKLYSHCDTEQQIDAYINQVHQSSDSITLSKAALYAAPPRREPLTEQQIWDAVECGVVGGIGFPTKAVAVARAIERAHGIGDE